LPRPNVPVTMGSPRFNGRDFNGFRATEAVFPPLLRLAPHQHERAILAVVLEGGFDVHFAQRSAQACVGRVSCEPATERHGNTFTRPRTRVLVLEIEEKKQEELRACAEVFERAGSWSSTEVDAIARRLTREIGHPDDVAALAAEGLFHQLVAGALRTRKRERRTTPPRWVFNAHDLLQASFLERIELRTIAAALGVTPMQLSREYHRHFGESPGETMRALRVHWAADRLARTHESLARIAHQAGFTDQSHFCRVFKRLMGETPGGYRKKRAALE
jgi:AraC family transcriptional regulator